MDNLKELEKELLELKLEIISEKDVEGKFGIGVQVDLDTGIDYSSIVESDFILKKYTERKDFMYIKFQNYDKEKERLTFTIASPIDKVVYDFFSGGKLDKLIGTTFPDLCWYHSEGTTAESAIEVETKFRSDAQLGDLTWFLPSRFADNLIEIIHTLNQALLCGLMNDVICYGPVLLEDN